MITFFMIIGLVFLISGGAGLFYTNLNFGTGSELIVFGNLTFGTFTFVGLAIIVFLVLFNSEFE
jgi:hypothetical protein